MVEGLAASIDAVVFQADDGVFVVALAAPNDELLLGTAEAVSEGTVLVNVIVVGAVKWTVVVIKRVLVEVVWSPVPQ